MKFHFCLVIPGDGLGLIKTQHNPHPSHTLENLSRLRKDSIHTYFFPLFVFQFLCFMMIDDTYALGIYTSRATSLKQKQCGVLCLFVCLFVWSLVCLCVLRFPFFDFQFLCFMMIDDTYALAIYTSRGASLKQKQCGFLCLFVCLFVWSLVCLCVLRFPLFVFQFLCFMMIDDTYALAIYTSRGASSKQKQCGFLCLFVCLFVWSLVCLCVLLFSFVCFFSFFVL